MAALRGEGYGGAASNALQSIMDKFLGGGTMVAKRFIDASRNFDPKTGKPISEDIQGIDRLYDQVKYFAGEFNPGIVKEFQNKAERNLDEQLARLFLAERKFTTDIPKAMFFNMKPIKQNLGSIRSKYSGSLRNQVDPAQAYNEANNLYRQNIGEIVKHVNNLRTENVDDEKIREYIDLAGKSYKLSKIEKAAIMGGVIPDMKVAVGIYGTTPEKAKAYADLYSVLPDSSKSSGQKSRKLHLLSQIW
jgi:hypothetical protein